MENLAEYLANYIEHEIELHNVTAIEKPYIPDGDDYQDWIKEGIDAYESINEIRFLEVDRQEFDLLNGD